MIKISNILRLLSQDKTLKEISAQTSYSIQEIKKILLELADNYDIKPKDSIENLKICSDKKAFVYTDGAARGNPGLSGVSCIIYNSKNEEVASAYKFIGIATNNIAEYKALILSLEVLANFLEIKKIDFFSDSELMVKQIQGKYRVASPNISEYYKVFMNKIKKYDSYSITHIKRDKNKLADKLANKAIDEHNGY